EGCLSADAASDGSSSGSSSSRAKGRRNTFENLDGFLSTINLSGRQPALAGTGQLPRQEVKRQAKPHSPRPGDNGSSLSDSESASASSTPASLYDGLSLASSTAAATPEERALTQSSLLAKVPD
ncbi:unnamed protein product, partial [Chrysoparadoxa australica]